MPHLQLTLLGAFQATLDGQPVVGFESNKVRALLAYLAVEADRPHPRATLAGLLWPERPDCDALANLRYALSNLRQAIGDRGGSLHGEPRRPALPADHTRYLCSSTPSATTGWTWLRSRR